MSHKHQLHIMNTFGSITYEFFNNKKNYHFDLTGAFSNIIEESEAIEYDDDDDDYDDEGLSDDTRSVDEFDDYFDDDDFDSFDDYNIKKEKRKKGDTFEMDFIDLD
mgnify:CR=1 FL=1